MSESELLVSWVRPRSDIGVGAGVLVGMVVGVLAGVGVHVGAGVLVGIGVGVLAGVGECIGARSPHATPAVSEVGLVALLRGAGAADASRSRGACEARRMIVSRGLSGVCGSIARIGTGCTRTAPLGSTLLLPSFPHPFPSFPRPSTSLLHPPDVIPAKAGIPPQTKPHPPILNQQSLPRHSRTHSRHSRVGGNPPHRLRRPASLPRVRGELHPPNTSVAVKLSGGDPRDAVLREIDAHHALAAE